MNLQLASINPVNGIAVIAMSEGQADMSKGKPHPEIPRREAEADLITMVRTRRSPRAHLFSPVLLHRRETVTHDIWEIWTAGASHAGGSFSLGL